LDADALLAWTADAIVMDTSILAERRSIHRQLNDCYVKYDERLPEDVLLVDTFHSRWTETIQRLHIFLSDRSPAEHKPGAQRQGGSEETVRSDNNLSRAWQAALLTISQKIVKEEDVTNRIQFEDGNVWT
jgi:hypothetical protein